MGKDYKKLCEMCFIMLMKGGYTLKYIKWPSKKGQTLVIISDPLAKHHIKNPTEKVKELARKKGDKEDYKKLYEEIMKIGEYLRKNRRK